MSNLTHVEGPFTFEYSGYELIRATLNGTDLRTQLSGMISASKTSALDIITDQIFELIQLLDLDKNLYELSIALTNYYFETFWGISSYNIIQDKTKKAEEIMMLACKNVWKQEASKSYRFHKGTPYFFLGYAFMVNGNIDLAFQMIHNGHLENLITYPRLGLDYKTAPSYLFICLDANNAKNAMLSSVLIMKKKIETFIYDHNRSSQNPISFSTFEGKFLKRINSRFDQTKFFLVYILMSLINLDTLEKTFLTNNAFSNLRKLEIMFGLSLIVDKTFAEKYNTKSISEGVIQYLVQQLHIPENDPTKLRNALSYSDGNQYQINGNSENVIKELLANGVIYRGSPLSYQMKCMLAVWNLRNFSAHNLSDFSGFDNLLSNASSSIFRLLFSALFFATETL